MKNLSWNSDLVNIKFTKNYFDTILYYGIVNKTY